MNSTLNFIGLYWSQITLVLLGVGYFVKRVLDLKSKKLEINYTLFQQHRIQSISNFLMNYAKADRVYLELSHYDIMNGKYTPKELDEIILPTLGELQKAVLEIKIYFDQETYTPFCKVMEEFFDLNNMIMRTWLDNNDRTKIIPLSNKIHSYKQRVRSRNEELLQQISNNVKLIYNAK
ncbi:hypothetical protein [Rurimicrobium arvi]|uniref:DUF4760 domain-containing protein n=1 Tax=Rurimicrobium arvi TaxID=2049916 RepID=A0ABP8MWZ9_9BACT